MSLGAQSTLVMLITLMLYLAVPIFLLTKGWPFRAGLAMLFVTLLPLLWQAWFTDSDAPGFGVLLFVMLPIPLALTAIGVLAALYRAIAELTRRLRQRES